MVWEFRDDEIQDDIPPEGEHLAFLTSVDLKRSRKGESMVSMQFNGHDSGFMLCNDVVMLEGRGLGIGLKKLEQLGVAKHDDEERRWRVLDVEDWVGRAVYLTLVHEEWRGKNRARVNFSARNFGYRQFISEQVDEAAREHVDDELRTIEDEEEIPF